MARKQVEGQMDLIEDTPEIKSLKKTIKAYEKLCDTIKVAAADNREKERVAREKVFEAFKSSGIEADSEGKYHLTIDDYDFTVGQDAQLKIKRKKVKDDEPVNDDGDDE